MNGEIKDRDASVRPEKALCSATSYPVTSS